jgi:hypothetical protein
MANHTTIAADEQAIARTPDLSPVTNLGSVAPRDPLTVHFDGQIAGFVRKRWRVTQHILRGKARRLGADAMADDSQAVISSPATKA